jgi:putative ABC transport system ATP-binding protein
MILKLTDVSKSFSLGNTFISILESVQMTIDTPQSIAIMGPSGSGKTTLLSLMAGLDVPTSGDIMLDDTMISALPESEMISLRQQSIGFIFQHAELIDTLTVRENILLPMMISKQPVEDAAVDSLMETLGIMDRKNAFPPTLSGGEKQRVAIARSVINDPAVIFADEPTGSLDAVTGQIVMDLLLNYVSDQQKTLVMITHDPDMANQTDQVYLLKNKTLISQ